MPLFGTKKGTPQDIVKNTCDALLQIIELKEKDMDKDKSKRAEKVTEEITKCMSSLKQSFQKASDYDHNPESVAQLSHEIYKANLIPLLIRSLPYLDFENKKDCVHIFGNLLQRKVGIRQLTVEYILGYLDSIVYKLIELYSVLDTALYVGMMLRECIKFEELCKAILYSDQIYNLFPCIEDNSFDVASDAFSTFKELVTRHKSLASSYLTTNYDKFFNKYSQLIQSENYVTKRQSTKLLGELLLERQNCQIMTKYVADPGNLKLIMNLLRHKSGSVQFEAFHVFKVFVANPDKPQAIIEILIKNNERLLDFLSSFQCNKDKDDEQFYDEKNYVIKTIRELKLRQ